MARICSILLADPNVFLREKIAEILSRQDNVGCVMQVGDPEPLLREARLNRPDLVLADIGLLAGRDLVVRLMDCCPRARIVAMVDTCSEPYVQAVQALGLDALLEKARVGEQIQKLIESLEDTSRLISN